MDVIHMSGVTKSYDDHPVLQGLDLRIGSGEVFALLGPNGAGKTTAVEILEGYRTADGGVVEVLGQDPARSSGELRARIGIVLQQTAAFEHTTVEELVDMFAALYPDPLTVDEAISSVDLTAQRTSIVANLSGGQRRRLDVACGIVGRPELLFLDEPTTGLDPEARRAMWVLIASLRERGATVLLTTHYLDEAEALADRIGVLLGGQLVDVAPPNQIGHRHRAVARVSFTPAEIDRPHFAAWDHDGDTVWVETNTPSALIADLADRHGELPGLSVRRPSLEDVYLQMVARAGFTGTNDHIEVAS